MSDGKRRLSGAEYRKRKREKEAELKKTAWFYQKKIWRVLPLH